MVNTDPTLKRMLSSEQITDQNQHFVQALCLSIRIFSFIEHWHILEVRHVAKILTTVVF